MLRDLFRSCSSHRVATATKTSADVVQSAFTEKTKTISRFKLRTYSSFKKDEEAPVKYLALLYTTLLIKKRLERRKQNIFQNVSPNCNSSNCPASVPSLAVTINGYEHLWGTSPDCHHNNMEKTWLLEIVCMWASIFYTIWSQIDQISQRNSMLQLVSWFWKCFELQTITEAIFLI